MHTGCRPNEAVYTVWYKSIHESEFQSTKSKFKATVPARFTKTNRDYLWVLPNEFDYLVPLICNLRDTGFKNESQFAKSLDNCYVNQFLEKAAVPVKS